MQPTERTAGVTASAVVAFLGSGFALLLALATCLPLMVKPAHIPPESVAPSPIDIRTILILSVVFYLALAAWGFATGAGLLKLRAWARTSILVFSGLALFCSLSGGLGGYFVARTMPTKSQGPDPAVVAGVLVAIMAVPGLVATWWLVYFNLKRVRMLFARAPGADQFTAEDGTIKTRSALFGRPISITVIAWVNLLGAPMMIWMLAKSYPAYLFGSMIEGPAAKAIYVAYLLLGLYVGIGLLKLWPRARLVAIGLSVLGVMNGLTMEFLPGREERLRKLLAMSTTITPSPISQEQLLLMSRMGMVAGWLTAGVILWILIAQKRAFAPGANQQAS